MSGIPFLIVFVLAIVAMILLISKFKVHPFLSILLVSFALGIIGGIPLADKTVDGVTTSGIASVIGSGFSSTFSSIGIVIIFGALIGALLEATGAALKLADVVVKLIGPKHPELAIELMGWVVSIPVFCDSGFVVLNPIRKALVKKTAVSSVAMTVCLSAGLYASHVFIPPTPGPIAAANTLGIGENILLVMALGTVVSIPALAGAYFYAKWIGKRVKANDEADVAADGEIVQTYEELVASYGEKLPSGTMSFAPIIVPIILMALSNVASILGWTGTIRTLCTFFGTAIVALAVGVILGIILLLKSGMGSKLYDLTNDTLKTVGPILFVTAAGSVLGKVISSTSLVSFITGHATSLQAIGIFFPFLLAAILKSAQGSSTVAITTTAGIMAPLMEALGMASPAMRALCVIAIGAGAMTVSHANDSYFWVVTNFGGMTPDQGYKTQTAVTLVEGVCSIVAIFVLSLFIH